MKKIIKEVLDEYRSRWNTDSINVKEVITDSELDSIAEKLEFVLLDRGRWIEFDEQTINGQRAGESWVCSICGKNTYDVEWDYIGSGTNHLGCELKSELSSEYSELRGKFIEESNKNPVPKQHERIRREKNSSQKKHEDKVFGDDIQEGLKRAKELSHQALEEGIKERLAEEIVDNKGEGYIYESLDGGETVYKRDFGSDKKILLTDEQKKQVKQIERELYKGEG